MFAVQSSNAAVPSNAFAGIASIVATTIAYSPEMDGASIKVSEDGGVLVLEGVAPISALTLASDIAMRFVGMRFCNLISPL